MKESPEIHFTPEQELLLWSIRVDHAKDQRIEEILKAGVDWNYVRETAIQHGIIPLLYKRLKEEMAILVPSEELMEFRKLFMANAVRNIQMTQQLLKVLDLLADAGVDAMPFKGPALAVQAYGDLSMRSFCDLDILIHKGDFDWVYDVLMANGFTPLYPIDMNIKKKILMLQKDLPFSGYGIYLEIHWEISEDFLSINLRNNEIWNEAESMLLENRITNSLSPEDTILILTIHGTKHFWQELKYLADLTYFIQNHPNIQWPEIISNSEKAGVRRILFIGLCLTKKYGQVKYPNEIENLLNYYNNIQDLVYYVKKHFFTSYNGIIFFTPPIFYIKSRERMKDRIKFGSLSLFDKLFIPKGGDYSAVNLPKSLFFLYFFIRPIRLMKGLLKL